ncbi:MAG: NmrA family transcriptional regulator, partial [Conexibacter sp.]|nr:NmrA family transcriptional regulator [Conexibacter sp.]
ARRGVELFAGDLQDSAAVAAAMTGARAAFGLTAPGADPDDEVRQGHGLVEAARRSDLRRLVLASVASAQQAPGVPHFATKARIEAAARSSGVPTIVTAPTWFFENLLSRRDDVVAGRLPLALPAGRRLQAVALADLGSVVATVMTGGAESAGRRIEIAGDELTPSDMARELSAVAGRPVHHQQVPLDDVARRSEDLAGMYAFLASTGYHVDIAALRAEFPHVGWQSFGQWARHQSWT